MPEVPKIVKERLRGRAGEPTPHPEANLLAAFAEQGLLATEREQILQHLAWCKDCRRVVLLALPQVESGVWAVAEQAEGAAIEQSVSRPSKSTWFFRPRFGWANLSWAALAAGVVVAGTLLLQHPAKQIAPVANKQTSPVVSQAPSITASAEPSVDASKLGERQKVAESRSEPARDQLASKTAAAGYQSKDALKAEKKALVGGDEKERTMAAAPSPVAQPQSSVRLDAAVSEASEVANKPAATDQAETGTLLAKNDDKFAVHKAKPATPEEQGAAMQPARKGPAVQGFAGVMARNETGEFAPQWSLSAGMLRRSTDGGGNWQTALPDGRLLCYAVRGAEVWAGGKWGVVFHSTDGGRTWTQVHPSIGEDSLSSDIAKMEVKTPTEIILSTSNGETWTSLDGGKSWARK